MLALEFPVGVAVAAEGDVLAGLDHHAFGFFHAGDAQHVVAELFEVEGADVVGFGLAWSQRAVFRSCFFRIVKLLLGSSFNDSRLLFLFKLLEILELELSFVSVDLLHVLVVTENFSIFDAFLILNDNLIIRPIESVNHLDNLLLLLDDVAATQDEGSLRKVG